MGPSSSLPPSGDPNDPHQGRLGGRGPDPFRESIDQRLLDLSPTLRTGFTELFQDLLTHGDFGYVLLGSKPATGCYFRRYSRTETENNCTPLLERYAENLALCQHSIFSNDGDFYIELSAKHNGSDISLYLARRSLCLEIIKANIHDFRDYFRSNNPAEILLEPSLAKHSQRELPIFLEGLLYGYGRENSALFARRSFLTTRDEETAGALGTEVRRLARTDCKPTNGHTSTQAELDSICERLKKFSDGAWLDSRIIPYDIEHFSTESTEQSPPPAVTLPTFLADPELKVSADITRGWLGDQVRIAEVVRSPNLLKEIITIDYRAHFDLNHS